MDIHSHRSEKLTELILRAKHGSRTASAELYARFEPLITKLAKSVSAEQFEDAKQELAIELMDAVSQFQPVTGERGSTRDEG